MPQLSKQEELLALLRAEALDGYRNAAMPGGMRAILESYRAIVPLELFAALRNYSILDTDARKRAIALAQRLLDPYLDQPGEILPGAGFHPDFVTWARWSGVQDVPSGAHHLEIRATPQTSASDGMSVAALRALPYPEYLRTEHWQQKRHAALARSGNRCQVCNRAGKLEVHHRTYERLGEEHDSDLTVLCDDCHGRFHASHPGFARRAGLTSPRVGTSSRPRSNTYTRSTYASRTATTPRKRQSRSGWVVGVLLAIGLLIWGIGSYSDKSHAQSTESAKSTISGVLMATYSANAYVTATAFSVATPVPQPAPTQVPTPAATSASTRRYDSSNLIYGSWPAFSPEISIRFFAPPWVVEIPGESHQVNAYHLRSASRQFGSGYEVIDIYRARNQPGGEGRDRWILENNAFLTALQAKDYSVTLGPTPQRIGEYLGQRGQFNYAQADNGLHPVQPA